MWIVTPVPPAREPSSSHSALAATVDRVPKKPCSVTFTALPGLVCWDCHSTTDMRGDGTEYNSIHETGALSADCEGCHVDGNDAGAPVYDHGNVDPHGGKIHCTACHSESVISCYDCHFNSVVDGHVKRAFTKVKNFILLVNRDKDGKIGTASFQSLTYDLPGGGDSTWVAFGPYPFNPTTTIEFSLPYTTRITMVVFDVPGKEIAKIYDNKVVKTGTHKVDFDPSKLASGIYFYQIRGENFARTRKMFLLK